MIFVQASHLLVRQMHFDKIVLLICICGTGNTLLVCKEKFKGCCVGYFWNNDTDKCELCIPGYIGENCSSQCPYPSYGHRCQGHCACDKDSCDVATGCRILTTFIQLCMPGYFGENCSLQCPFPSYGYRCQGRCNCDKDLCDVFTGCRNPTTGDSFASTKAYLYEGRSFKTASYEDN